MASRSAELLALQVRQVAAGCTGGWSTLKAAFACLRNFAAPVDLLQQHEAAGADAATLVGSKAAHNIPNGQTA